MLFKISLETRGEGGGDNNSDFSFFPFEFLFALFYSLTTSPLTSVMSLVHMDTHRHTHILLHRCDDNNTMVFTRVTEINLIISLSQISVSLSI